MSRHILIVDDDDLLRRSLAFNLEQAGFRVSSAASGEAGLAAAGAGQPDLILLDINLPGMDGLEALRHFRDRFAVPVIFLTARRRELDEVLGLELGANDYVTKPFDKDVLIARIRATLRQANPSLETSTRLDILKAGDLVIDPARHEVTVGGRAVDLAPREFRLLHFLASQPGRVFATDELLDGVWGAEYAGEPQVVYVQIRALREKLEDEPDKPRRLLTVRGVGYKLVPLPA